MSHGTPRSYAATFFLLAGLLSTGDTCPAQDAAAPPVPDVLFLPTPIDVVYKMLEAAELTKDDVVYDLGCGDGRIVAAAAKLYGCKAVGFDIDPVRVKESRANIEKLKLQQQVRIEQRDIFSIDLSKATVVTMYLLPDLNVRLIPQLQKLKPGARILSHDFDMEGVEPDKVINVESKIDHVDHAIYLWTTPLKRIGGGS